MHIDIIESSPSLAALEDNWNAVYDADPEAQIFLSWKWLNGWLASIKGPWIILAAKAHNNADAPYVAFFPLRLESSIEESDVVQALRMAGISPPITPASFVRPMWKARSSRPLRATSSR